MKVSAEISKCCCGEKAVIDTLSTKVCWVKCARTRHNTEADQYECWHGPICKTEDEAIKTWNAMMEKARDSHCNSTEQGEG